MKNLWPYIAVFFSGMVSGMFLLILIIKDNISNDTIEINRPKMKNNSDSTQEFTSNIPDLIGQAKERKRFKLFKRKNHGT